MAFDDIVWPDGEDNIGGTAQSHFYIPIKNITVLPVPINTSNLNKVSISADIEVGVGKKFFKLYSTMDTGMVNSKMVGEVDGKSWENSFEFFFPGTREEALAIIATWANSNMLFIPVEADGQKRIIGNAKFPAKLMLADGSTGAKTADRKGIKLRVESRDVIPAPIYKGIVPTEIIEPPPDED